MIEWFTELDNSLITPLIGLIGVFLTAILSLLSYYFKNRREAKRDARQVLYLFLEIRYSLCFSIFDAEKATDEYLTEYVKKLNGKGVPLTKEHFSPDLVNLISSFFEEITKTAKMDIKQRVLTPLETSLSKLASEVPVLAYRLNGKDKIERLSRLVKSHSENIMSIATNEVGEQNTKDITINMISKIRDTGQIGLVDHIDEDILLLAWYCGLKEYIQCKFILAKKPVYLDNQFFEEIDKMFDELYREASDVLMDEKKGQK